MKNISSDFARISLAAADNFYEIAQVKADGREENLRLAIDAYEKALRFFTHQKFPVQYATTQNNLGVSYRNLAEVRDKEENLGKAIKAYEESLKVRTLQSFPMDYAGVNFNLCGTYLLWAENAAKTDEERKQMKEKAVLALKESMMVFEKEGVKNWLNKAKGIYNGLKEKQ